MCHRGVLVCRAGTERGHAELKAKFRVDVISMAAPSEPSLRDGNCARQDIADQMRELVELSVMGSQLEAEVGILSAFGCGAFGHPLHREAEFYSELLKHHRGAKIVSAALEDHNAGRTRNPKGNHEPIAERFLEFAYDPDPVLDQKRSTPAEVKSEEPATAMQEKVVPNAREERERAQREKDVAVLIELLKAGDGDAVLDWVDRWDESQEKMAKGPRKSRWALRLRSSERRVVSPRRSWDKEEEPHRRAKAGLALLQNDEVATSDAHLPGRESFPPPWGAAQTKMRGAVRLEAPWKWNRRPRTKKPPTACRSLRQKAAKVQKDEQ
jgi:hypothetical protein